jgi:hypothetical protein
MIPGFLMLEIRILEVLGAQSAGSAGFECI